MILSDKFFIENGDFNNKKVLVRVDYNVPTTEDGTITDNTRITKSLPTLKYLLQNDAKIILISHKGRPKGERVKKLSLEPVREELEKILKEEGIDFNSVKFIDKTIEDEVKTEIDNLGKKDILILENLRFYKEEKKNNDEFANKLASLCDSYVSDAFGAVHRSHASIVGVPKFVKNYYYGKLIKSEIDNLNYVLNKQDSPLIAIVGGAKISSKIDVLTSLLNKADSILIGGAMAYTFLEAKGLDVGNSLVEKDKLTLATQIMNKAEQKGVNILLPVDHIAVKNIEETAKKVKTSNSEIKNNLIGVDIGSKTIKEYKKAIKSANIIFWNGPMGIFEMEPFANGTFEIAKIISSKKAFKVVGGGDSVAAIKKAGLEKGFSHISTGGGASLEYVEGKKLPGLELFE